MPNADNLARAVDAAQSILGSAAADEARRVERALAASARNVILAMAERDPSSSAGAREIAGGFALYGGAGNPLTQAMAIGMSCAVTPAELDAIEAILAPSGGTRQLELTPYVDPSLPALLAVRGYRVHEWQLVWTRAIPDAPLAPPPEGVRITRATRDEGELACRVMLEGFLESAEVPDSALGLMRPLAWARDTELFIAWLGDEPIGAATVAWADGVVFGGSAVRPAFRRRGAQGALIRARLDRAMQLHCTLACSNTLPGTASRRNMERAGYAVAYPKIVMLKD